MQTAGIIVFACVHCNRRLMYVLACRSRPTGALYYIVCCFVFIWSSRLVCIYSIIHLLLHHGSLPLILRWLWPRTRLVDLNDSGLDEFLDFAGNVGILQMTAKKKDITSSITPIFIAHRASFQNTHSPMAFGSFCICSRMTRIAGSLRICCTSGSAIARLPTSCGFEPIDVLQVR